MRPTVDFSPSVWENHFISYVPTLKEEGYQIDQHLENMKAKVRSVLQSHVKKASEKLEMIDVIQRLGVSYHFESEIEEILQHMHKSPPYYNEKDANDLYTIALWFRLLRQQGYNISCDIFEQFREHQGNFKEALTHDFLGMLSLYEASHLRIHGEDVLDQALVFTTFHLNSSLSDMSPNLKEKVTHALNCPLRKGIPRIEAKYYISMYSREVSKDDLLLQFAILDFNELQGKHQEELSHLTEWWKKFDYVKTVPYARHRLVEGYFWALGLYFEPQYRIGRKILAKLVSIMTLIDDSYDAYGTVEELEPFTEALQRCDISLIDSLPDCMKVACKAMLDLFKELELITAENGTTHYVQYTIREVQKAIRAYFLEAKWRDKGYIPTYDEYMKNGIINAYPFIGVASILGLGQIATKEIFDWISDDDYPKIINATGIVSRLKGDLGSHKFERKREHVVSAVECTANQYGISEEEAHKQLNKEVENAWKEINEECLKPNSVPKPVVDCVVNFSRVIELLYVDFQDRFTNAELLKEHVAAIFLDPIRISNE